MKQKIKNELNSKTDLKKLIKEDNSKYIELKSIINPLGKFYESIPDKIKERFSGYNSYIVHIDISATRKISLIVNFNKDDYFIHENKLYILDRECVYYDQSLRMNCLDYFVDFSLPIRREISTKDLKDSIYNSFPDIKLVTNPVTAKRWIESTIVRDLLRTQSAGTDNLILIFNFILTGITLLVLLWSSGVFGGK